MPLADAISGADVRIEGWHETQATRRRRARDHRGRRHGSGSAARGRHDQAFVAARAAFFVQERTGFGGRRFRLFKLRTMVPHAEDLKQTLTHLNARSWPDFKVDHDPRVTRIGRILRMTSLDELPQLWNVLRGDMSIVGPRPTSLEPVAYAGWQCERFEMRPGMTGLWQVSARGSSSFVTRIRLDIAYLTHQSLRLDAAILIRTVPAVLFGRGAG